MKTTKFLNELKIKDSGIIKKLGEHSVLKRKFLDMGVIPGTEFEIVKLAPLGDPIDIKIKGYHLSIRKEEAKQIIVEVDIK